MARKSPAWGPGIHSIAWRAKHARWWCLAFIHGGDSCRYRRQRTLSAGLTGRRAAQLGSGSGRRRLEWASEYGSILTFIRPSRRWFHTVQLHTALFGFEGHGPPPHLGHSRLSGLNGRPPQRGPRRRHAEP